MIESVTFGRDEAVRGALPGISRVLGDIGKRDGGPVLVCVGALHGNEPSGVLALQCVFEHLERDASGLRGRLIGLVGNRLALAAGERFLDADLNRIWRDGVLDGSSRTQPREMEEVRELARELEVFSRPEHSRGFVLDLHSTSGGGSCFTTLDDTLANRSLAFAIPVPHVLGLEEELAGTLLSYVNELGVAGIGFEAGQHLDPQTERRAEAAVWIAMEATGVLARGKRAEVARAREFLTHEHAGFPDVVEVRHRHAIRAGDEFTMSPGFRNFQPVELSQLLARDRTGLVTSPIDGLILMPLYQGQGSDGYFIVRRVRGAWLKLSAALRRLRVDPLLSWLPGVQRSPDRSDTFVVDLRRARVLALQVFHLLGYKRIQRTEHSLIMRKRDARSR
ncbi:MAG: succinylglutamate desuccinylase/aspartoacylase family protein [bacterium]|nr:succinylglutamate desuccinylase/aspartoacylase family protein [bacterium]